MIRAQQGVNLEELMEQMLSDRHVYFAYVSRLRRAPLICHACLVLSSHKSVPTCSKWMRKAQTQALQRRHFIQLVLAVDGLRELHPTEAAFGPSLLALHDEVWHASSDAASLQSA